MNNVDFYGAGEYVGISIAVFFAVTILIDGYDKHIGIDVFQYTCFAYRRPCVPSVS